jgi:hypothetical protein
VATRQAVASKGALDPLADAARDHRLVILAGAGISMLPPTSLPNWWAFNEAVLRALAGRMAEATNLQFSDERLSRLLGRRDQLKSFTPDFMAQLMEEEAGPANFEVLEALDTDEVNENHSLIAALAAAGVVRAVITTARRGPAGPVRARRGRPDDSRPPAREARAADRGRSAGSGPGGGRTPARHRP